jgi:hypothetical protein
MSLKMDESQCPRCFRDATGHWPAVPYDGEEDMRAVCCDKDCLDYFDNYLDFIFQQEREMLESELGPPKGPRTVLGVLLVLALAFVWGCRDTDYVLSPHPCEDEEYAAENYCECFHPADCPLDCPDEVDDEVQDIIETVDIRAEKDDEEEDDLRREDQAAVAGDRNRVFSVHWFPLSTLQGDREPLRDCR